jgi:imidazolonepropionase-like amidohydrolase
MMRLLLIKNAKVITMAGQYLPQGDVLIDGARIAAVGNDLSAPDARVIDAAGLYALPGLVDSHCHIGMWDDSMGFEGSDGNEITNPVTPQMRALDSLYPRDRCFSEALAGGVTTVATGPGSANPIGGQFVAMKTAGSYLEDMIIREPLALKIAFGENPKRCYGEGGKLPMTRMGTAAVIREAFVKAQNYMRKMDAADPDKRPDRDLGLEVLVKALRREIKVKAHAHRSDDILTAIRIGREFNLDLTLEHCTEGYIILDRLAREQLPVTLGPLLSDRSKIELGRMTFEAPAMFERAGVKFALMTDSPVIPEQYLAVEAAICVRNGLSEEGALKAITINAAEAIGLAGRVGSLEAGKDADICLYDAHPLDARAHVTHSIVNGEVAFER